MIVYEVLRTEHPSSFNVDPKELSITMIAVNARPNYLPPKCR